MIFPKTCPFLGGKGWRNFFFFFQTLLSPKLLWRLNNTIISFYHISNDFCHFPRGGTKTRKKSKCWTLVGFPLVSVPWISKIFWIWTVFTYMYHISWEWHRIRNVKYPPRGGGSRTTAPAAYSCAWEMLQCACCAHALRYEDCDTPCLNICMHGTYIRW